MEPSALLRQTSFRLVAGEVLAVAQARGARSRHPFEWSAARRDRYCNLYAIARLDRSISAVHDDRQINQSASTDMTASGRGAGLHDFNAGSCRRAVEIRRKHNVWGNDKWLRFSH